MNVLFHTTAAIGVAVLLTDTKSIETSPTLTKARITAFFAFTVGLISHGALDYIPHCYPLNSKVDVIGGLAIIVALTWLTNKKYRLITASACLGSVFPDIIDLLPTILNKYVGLNSPVSDKLFPWHWHEYSGSLYDNNCNVSNVNHMLLLLTVAIICWCRRGDIKIMISKE